MLNKIAISAAALGVLLAAGAANADHKPGHKGGAKGKSCPELNAIDPDNDGVMTKFELTRRAWSTFSALNKDRDRTLEPNEVAGRLTPRQFKAANPDNDGTIDRIEWIRYARSLFDKANNDGDRTIECDELGSPAGRALVRMLR